MPQANKELKTLSPAQFAFVKWLYANHPNVAKAAEERHESLEGFFDTAGKVFENVMQKAPDLLQQYVTGKQQIEQLKINLERARAGQYPVDSAGNVYTGGATLPQAVAQVPVWAWALAGGLLVYLIVGRR